MARSLFRNYPVESCGVPKFNPSTEDTSLYRSVSVQPTCAEPASQEKYSNVSAATQELNGAVSDTANYSVDCHLDAQLEIC